MDAIEQDVPPRHRLDFEQDEDSKKSQVVDETIDTLHSRIYKELIPRVGMEFETEEAAYEFYNSYALAIGFSIRKSSAHTRKGVVLDRIFVCSCEGKRAPDKRDDAYKSQREETTFGCLALLKVSCRKTGKYCVVNFVADHNHNLASPRKTHLFRSHRNLSTSQAVEVDMADCSGIAPRNAYELMARKVGGRENLGFARVDYKNYLRSKRSLQVQSGDTCGVLEYLQSMRVQDPAFFYDIQLDEDDLITKIFWADSNMIVDYGNFGDVVCFDTTYRKHKDGRPIALFCGVNHHRQTVIFGFALLYDETTDSFVWLFETFSRAMGGKLPKTMLTDQDAAMSRALSQQWPETCHRLCIWHIFQNAAIHLSGVFAKYNDFARDFSNCIYDYDHEKEFLDAWSEMLDKYELRDNDWLNRMFKIKEKWALVYGKDTFCGDMISTQRSESMNKAIKHYVSYKHDLGRFFEHFQRLLDDRRYDELIEDFKASQSKVALSFPVAILKHAASVYTPAVYKLFHAELYKSYDCHTEICGDMGVLIRYNVTPHKKHHSYVVSYDNAQETVCCSCRKFEFAGLLCSHILKVFCSRGITEVPGKYILKRWTKNAKSGVSRAMGESLKVYTTTAGGRSKDLCLLSTRLVTKAAEFENGYTLVKEALLKVEKELDSISMKRPTQSRLHTDEMKKGDLIHENSENGNDMMKMARGIKAKPKSGSQSSKRPKSALETARKKTKRPKHTSANNNVMCPVGDPTVQHTIPSHLSQESQILQFDRGASLQSVGYIHPWGPFGDNYATLSQYGHGNMYISSLPIQSNQQFQPKQMAFSTNRGHEDSQIQHG